MRENLYILLCWLLLIDSSILFVYFVGKALSRAANKFMSYLAIKDNIGVEKTDKQ